MDTERLSKELQQPIDRKNVLTRPGAGGSKLSYVEGWKAIDIANEKFNFNGWSSEIIKTEVDFADLENGRWNVGIHTVVRVSLASGTYHEDTGYGISTNERNRGMAYEKARKEAATDALKRALRLFGNALGNCIYDKDFRNNKQTNTLPNYFTKQPTLEDDFFDDVDVEEALSTLSIKK